ncbi:hypothetical protein [Enterococcus sp. AZ194]|uniref:hypothetical protein n=1 Tax=Enterococcus sp. AZ194 TaxID=2774629 RepID=UPI003F6838A7
MATKETKEEAGLTVTPKRLIKVVDKAKHEYPKSLEYVYKFFIYCVCEAESVAPFSGLETSAVAFYKRDEISSIEATLSVERNTLADIYEAFDYFEKPWSHTKFD